MGSLVQTIAEFCSTHGVNQTYWVGYSGGLDSHVLLHILATLRSDYPLKLRAVYINHGLSPYAQDWAQHCAHICQQLQIDYIERKVPLPIGGKSIEAVARDYRYNLFEELMGEGDVLLTAHHQDDQAETLLLQMVRGAGPKGLACMPRIKKWGKGQHGRPLLDFSRIELEEYAKQHHLVWIEDESNTNMQFARNYVREKVLPILKQRWPAVTQTLQRVSENCADAQAILQDIAQQDWLMAQGQVAGTLSVKQLKTLTPPRQRQVLRNWLEKLGFLLPTALKMQQLQKDMLMAAPDKMPCITWEGVEIRRFQDDLYAMAPLLPHDSTQVWVWDGKGSLELPGVGVLVTKEWDEGSVMVRFRQGGEKLRLPGQEKHRTLKNLFQEWKVAPWLRARIPLVFSGEELVAVVGYVGTNFNFFTPPPRRGV